MIYTSTSSLTGWRPPSCSSSRTSDGARRLKPLLWCAGVIAHFALCLALAKQGAEGALPKPPLPPLPLALLLPGRPPSCSSQRLNDGARRLRPRLWCAVVIGHFALWLALPKPAPPPPLQAFQGLHAAVQASLCQWATTPRSTLFDSSTVLRLNLFLASGTPARSPSGIFPSISCHRRKRGE